MAYGKSKPETLEEARENLINTMVDMAVHLSKWNAKFPELRKAVNTASIDYMQKYVEQTTTYKILCKYGKDIIDIGEADRFEVYGNDNTDDGKLRIILATVVNNDTRLYNIETSQEQVKRLEESYPLMHIDTAYSLDGYTLVHYFILRTCTSLTGIEMHNLKYDLTVIGEYEVSVNPDIKSYSVIKVDPSGYELILKTVFLNSFNTSLFIGERIAKTHKLKMVHRGMPLIMTDGTGEDRIICTLVFKKG